MSRNTRHAEARPRAAIYARYSTDLQNEKSTEDQFALCRDYADREGYAVVETFKDEAKSGASMHGRDGLAALTAAAKAGRFDVLIVEHPDRIARSLRDLPDVHERFKYLGIRIVAVHGGELTTATVGLFGIVGQMQREDGALKVHRGMVGLVRQGLTAGGRAYGYRPDPANPGKPIIVESEAATVRRIFEDYAKGTSPKAICHRLTAEHVPAPRGMHWSHSALIGFASRGTGMLRNPLYVGKLVWNKVRMVKNPDTGKRVSRPRPESEWQTADVPELRIVPQELFDAVQAQIAGRAQVAKGAVNIGANKRPQYLLSGLVKCGGCGGGMARAGSDGSKRTRLKCSRHENSGACPDPQSFYADEIEGRVFDGLASELATPEQITLYAERYIKARRDGEAHEDRRRREIEKRIEAIEKNNDRLLDMLVENVGVRSAIDARMKAQDAERQELVAELATLPEGSNVVLLPSAIKRLAEKLRRPRTDWLHSPRAKIAYVLGDLDDMGELGPIVRELIRTVTVWRDGEDGRPVIRVEANLSPFLEENGQPLGAVPLVEGKQPGTNILRG